MDRLYRRRTLGLLALPGTVWLILLFVVPLYAVVAIALGTVDPIFGGAEPIWNPLHWNPGFLSYGLRQFAPSKPFFISAIRTIQYVCAALLLSIVIAYPVAFYVARRPAGPYRNTLLALLALPFLTNYLMRMIAWVDLLSRDGYVNRILVDLHILRTPYGWLEGHASTVVFGLVYGYIPLMILPLFVVLDRLDPALLEAGHDLGAGPVSTFWRVIVPASRQGIFAGALLVGLPMVGDYYTANLMSGAPSTSMLGNQITLYVQGGAEQNLGATLVLIVSCFLAIFSALYLIALAREPTVAL